MLTSSSVPVDINYENLKGTDNGLRILQNIRNNPTPGKSRDAAVNRTIWYYKVNRRFTFDTGLRCLLEELPSLPRA
jgi:hypothetical protein